MANDLSPGFGAQQMSGPFELTRFLEGRSVAWGIFEDRFGKVKRRFQISLVGSWNGPRFELRESFQFDDGAVEERVWVLEPSSDGRSFVGTCGDAVGIASGEVSEGAAAMRYTFRLKLNDRTINLVFHDRFFPIGDRVMINRTKVSKWGLKVGEITAVFQRLDEEYARLRAA